MVTWIGFGRKRSYLVGMYYTGGTEKDHEKLGPSKFRARNPERKSGVLSPERTWTDLRWEEDNIQRDLLEFSDCCCGCVNESSSFIKVWNFSISLKLSASLKDFLFIAVACLPASFHWILNYVSLQSSSRVSEMYIDHNGVCFVMITLYVQEFVGSAFNISCSFVMLSVCMYLNT